MEENVQAQDEISLVQIIKLFLKKIKLLILVTICGAIVGAGLGVATTFDEKYYGTTIEFYVNPRLDKSSSTQTESQYGVYGAYGRHVMDNMVKLLSSELFAEKLMLNATTGLPEKGDNEELNGLIDVAQVAKTTAIEKVELAKSMLNDLNEANKAYSEANSRANTLWSQYRNQHPNEPNLNSTPTIIPGETDLNNAIDDRDKARAKVDELKLSLETAEKDADNANDVADEEVEKALEKWRETYVNYDKDLRVILDSISYSYISETDAARTEDLARSFIYVKIELLNDEEGAIALYKRICKDVPDFVETNMAVPSGYDGTNCRRITRNDGVKRTNEGNMIKSSIKYGLFLAAATLVVACVAVIVIDRSDKRLRTLEQITDVLNVPVLGVIPSIQEKEKNDEKEVKKEEKDKEVKNV